MPPGWAKAVYSSTDLGTAQKILSLARYLLATNGQSLPGITTWQYTHPLPYWVRKELDSRLDEFRTTGSACPFDTNTHGITIILMQEFSRTRKYASRKKGLSAGDTETFHRRIYLHLYFNPLRRVEQDAAFDKDIFELKRLIEDGQEESLSESAAEKVRKYLHINHYGKKASVTFNEKAIAAQKKYHGYFALVSNCEKDSFECLRKYRLRETIEFFFESGKQKADGYRTRVWSSECLMGRMFVQFVSLCYYEYLSGQLRQLKHTLAAEIKSEKDTEQIRKTKKKLLSCLNNTPVYLTLQWFDAVEDGKVSAPLLSKRWTTEISERDRIFLEKLGVPAS